MSEVNNNKVNDEQLDMVAGGNDGNGTDSGCTIRKAASATATFLKHIQN